MSVDRRVALDLSVPDFRTETRQQRLEDPSSNRDEPGEEEKERFESAMMLAEEEKKTGPDTLPSPWQLFGAGNFSTNRVENDIPLIDSYLAENISCTVEHLMVSDGSSGGRMVRIDLKDDSLPGVSVVVQESQGRLRVDFVCSVENSRRKLDRLLSKLAANLAERLHRDVLMGVKLIDEDDSCLTEVLARG